MVRALLPLGQLPVFLGTSTLAEISAPLSGVETTSYYSSNPRPDEALRGVVTLDILNPAPSRNVLTIHPDGRVEGGSQPPPMPTSGERMYCAGIKRPERPAYHDALHRHFLRQLATLQDALELIAQAAHPSQACRALGFLHAAVKPLTLRELMINAMKTIEAQRPVAEVVQECLRTIDSLMNRDEHIVDDVFILPEVEEAIGCRVRESLAMEPPATRWVAIGREASLDGFLRLSPRVIEGVIQTWQVYYWKLYEYRNEGLDLPREYDGNPLAFYEETADQFLGNSDIPMELRKPILSQGWEFFPIIRRVLFDLSGEVRPSIRTYPKIRRLREFYGLKIPPEMENDLLQAVDRLAMERNRRPASLRNRLGGVAAARRFLPGAPPFMAELAYHFYVHQETSPNNFGFVLTVARLLQGITLEEAPRKGFTHNELYSTERGTPIRREKFRSVVVRYGVPYKPLAYAYGKTFFPNLDLSRLGSFRQPVVIDKTEVRKVRAYLRRSPTFGERVFFARLERDISFFEMKRILASSGADPTRYDTVEDNTTCPSLETIQFLCRHLYIPLDEALSLILLTHFPELDHPRLRKEPVYLDFRNRKVETEKINTYTKRPGTIGEEIFFLRKRRLLSLADLARTTEIERGRLGDFEANRARPSNEELDRLAKALGADRSQLASKVVRTLGRAKLPTHRVSTLERIRQGWQQRALDWGNLSQRPPLILFKRAVAEHGVHAEDLAFSLNRRFSPQIVLAEYPSFNRESIYIASDEDERKLVAYREAGRQTLGEILFFARKSFERNWTVSEACKRLGIDIETLQNLEWNRRPPKPATLEKCAAVYGLDFDRLRSLVSEKEKA